MKNKIMMVLGFVVSFFVLLGSYVWLANETETATGPVKIITIQTKDDADCTLLYQDGAAVLIDTGEEQDAEHIVEVLKQNNITKLDCMILSHSDKDHVGGALAILQTIPVERVVESPYEEANERMLEINHYLEANGITVLYPTRTWRLQAGGMQLLIYPPLEKHYNDSNNYSLATLVQHENVNLLFTGDALRKRSEELLLIEWPKIDLYKVPHHGRKNSKSRDMFEVLQPQYGVVTAKSADGDVLEAALEVGTELFFSGEQECCFISNGEILTIEKE